ncbi:hypothetical protein LGH82_23585 [Mesorhizobium sp. PAMC28654]|uniref:hypothetical protein n=1 Tax=Mesorhizobium sp. PAMC28654 TaxID=2880934 RepID=UPI001D09BB81|nr:hypothetical protein [Mesorhizobium sp. PAMC28654]UDL88119.1 hypothetical protein LGH82_23585 [Mesorhizobium sp. PAMC28654]
MVIVDRSTQKEYDVNASPNEIEGALDLSSLDAARESAVRLQRDKQLVSATRDAGFFARIERLWNAARDKDGVDLLKAVSLLFRISAVAKHVRPRFEDLVSQIANVPAASPQTLVESDDRRYLGEGLRFASGSWKANYAAQAAVEEVSGEEAREQFVAVLVESVGSLGGALQALRFEFDSWRVDTQDVGASRARRMARIVSCLKRIVIEQDPEVGNDVGAALLAFARSAIAGEPILDVSARVQAAEALLDLASSIVRFHFSIASDSETYAVVAFVRRWFPSDNPPTELQPILNIVGRQVLEALIFLGKQGVPNDQLRRTFLLVLGESRGLVELRQVGSELPGIPEELRHWFLSGRLSSVKLATNDAVDETALRTIDRDIAYLFRDASDLVATLDRIEDDLPAAMSNYEPRLVPSVTRLSEGVKRITQRVNVVAARRQMRFGGMIGQLVDFNPVDHELPFESLKGSVAKIKLPSVIKGAEGAPPIVILKAEVEGDG